MCFPLSSFIVVAIFVSLLIDLFCSYIFLIKATGVYQLTILHGWVLSCLAFEWQRGQCWPCFDRKRPVFLVIDAVLMIICRNLRMKGSEVSLKTQLDRGEWLWNSPNFKGSYKGAHLNAEKGLCPAQYFVLCSLIMLDWPDPNVFIGSLSSICRKLFVLCRVRVEQKDRRMGFITIPLY